MNAGDKLAEDSSQPAPIREAIPLASESGRYPPQVRIALERLADSGLSQPSYAPPLHRMLWRLGINMPPPHFAGFLVNFLFAGIFFGVGWGSLMALYFWTRHGMPPLFAAPYAVAAGVAFGAAMALYFRHGARKHKLPSWPSLRD